MSGGSYEYLCFKDSRDILDAEEQLQQMADRLAKLGYASDAAKETEDTLLLIRQFRNRLDARIERLSGVWKGIEWWDSGDRGEEEFKRDLAEYRGEDSDAPDQKL